MVMQPAHSRKLEMKRVVIAPIGHCRGRLKGGMKVKFIYLFWLLTVEGGKAGEQ